MTCCRQEPKYFTGSKSTCIRLRIGWKYLLTNTGQKGSVWWEIGFFWNCRQQTVALRKNLKLAAKFFGPFQIVEKIGAVAYKLKLPPGSKVHPVFHVSLLKPKLGPHQSTTPTLPEFDGCDQCLLQLAKVLQRWVIMRNGVPVIQYLIKWHQLGEEEASWEDQTLITRKFPEFQPWGQGCP